MNIEEILLRKINGIDNTEEESAFIKGLMFELIENFPLEFSEVLEKVDLPISMGI